MELLHPSPAFPLINLEKPKLFREQFPYDQVPRILFEGVDVPLDPAEEFFITDTTFRDGQQARAPYTPKQILKIYELLSKLGGERGLIRQAEFFLYSDRDRQAVELCLAQGRRYPEITSWIRANKTDFALVKQFGLKETGILTSVSDYHIYLKLKTDRKKIIGDYLGIVQGALNEGIIPRCHFEDLTRADIYGFVLPFAEQLLKLSQSYSLPVKIRLCDTMGYGLTYPGAALPRSIPRLIHAFRRELGYPSAWLEWHGHNDFHKVHINASSAWLYGVSSLNASLLGYGERTGNPPLEAAVIEYLGLTGDRGIDTRVISEIADYYRQEVMANIPDNYPFVGEDFNTTRAGVHADGLLKNPEIYTIFDTEKLLNRPIRVMVTDKSGYAGIARWLNENIPLIREGKREEISKRHPGVSYIYDWVNLQYERGRISCISGDELITQAKRYIPSLFESDFDRVREAASRIATRLSARISQAEALKGDLDRENVEKYLEKILKKEASIQLIAITNTDGYRIGQVHTQHGEKALFRNLLNKNFNKHEWFSQVIATGEPYVSDLFFSKYTKRLILTLAHPLRDQNNQIRGVIDIDFAFETLAKLISHLPEEITE
ncbi:MAG: histone-lysine N-methyltransferase [Spirochaetales bacterium]|jgi:isopropylmalate/homocitrate/citramalate synthase|nr:histone-lysine N-methyltransferase [Spirochaetales bacterium]